MLKSSRAGARHVSGYGSRHVTSMSRNVTVPATRLAIASVGFGAGCVGSGVGTAMGGSNVWVTGTPLAVGVAPTIDQNRPTRPRISGATGIVLLPWPIARIRPRAVMTPGETDDWSGPGSARHGPAGAP